MAASAHHAAVKSAARRSTFTTPDRSTVPAALKFCCCRLRASETLRRLGFLLLLLLLLQLQLQLLLQFFMPLGFER